MDKALRHRQEREERQEQEGREEADLLAALGPALREAAANAADHDEAARFPHETLAALRAAGALAAPLPPALGGAGLGTTQAGAAGALALLRALGRAQPAIGRVFEGHMNALRLVCRYGTDAQARAAGADARAGHLFGIWVTDAPGAPVTLAEGVLRGRKGFVSGVGAVSRPLITVKLPAAGECLALVALPPEAGRGGAPLALHGMRAAATAPFDFTGIPLAPARIIGRPGDYMAQPEISLGAWRGLAVMLGIVDALVCTLMEDLAARGRDADPHQRARIGRALIARETAALWVTRAAHRAEAADAGEDAANYVKLARIAFERAAFDAMALAQQAIGMAGFLRPHPAERLARDLATYLRQPALDMVLDEAAAHFTAHPPP